MEEKIKKLEQKGDDFNELKRLRQELVALKSSSQSEINDLNQELAQAKCKEAQLLTKIQALTAKNQAKSETEAANSCWNQIKTPLYFFGGGLIILCGWGWVRSKK